MRLVDGGEHGARVGKRYGDLEVLEMRDGDSALVGCVCGAKYVAQLASLDNRMKCPRKIREENNDAG